MGPGIVDEVLIKSDVYSVCFTHALTTEKEEIMGMLLGNRTLLSGGDSVGKKRWRANVLSVRMLVRSDRRKDRVEISDVQQAEAISYAEELSKELGEEMTVVGWYHSHPHITIRPSHVDLRTQGNYQMMEPCFVGLIFNGFNRSPDGSYPLKVMCFQSLNQGTEERAIPLLISPSTAFRSPCLTALYSLARILHQEERKTYDDFALSTYGGVAADPFSVLHNSAVYTKSLCDIYVKYMEPLVSGVRSRLERNRHLLATLREERKELEERETGMMMDGETGGSHQSIL
eukprot:Nk52_evm11s2085 gene=Nk52_evmTU11s2085